MLRQYNCKNCNVLVTNNSSPKANYCNNKICQKVRYKEYYGPARTKRMEQQRQYYALHKNDLPTEDKLCKICNKIFTPRDVKQFLCSPECRHKYYSSEEKLICCICYNEFIDHAQLIRSKYKVPFCNAIGCQKVKRKIRYSMNRDKEIAIATKNYRRYVEENTPYIQGRKEYCKKYFIEHKEEHKIKSKIYREGEARPKVLAYKKEYNANPKNKLRKKKWVEDNLPAINEYRRDYSRGKGKFIVKLISNKRRRKLDNIVHNFTAEQLKLKFESFKGICPECGKYAGDKLTLEHIVPVSVVPEGHIYELEGITFLCKSCNSSKKAKEYTEWVNYKNAVFAN